MGTYTARTRNIGKRPRSKRLRELGGTIINKSGADVDLSGCELLSNKVTAVGSESTDAQYPSAKCLYDALTGIGNAIAALNEVFSAIGHVHAIGDITGLQTALDGKAAADHTHSQYLTSHQTVTDKSATIGTSLTTIATIGGIDIKAKIGSYAASDHTHSGYLTSHQTVTDKSATIGTSLTTIATIGGTDIKAKIGSYAASSHTHSYLPLSGGTMTGNILGGATAALGTTSSPFHQLVLGGATNATMGASTGNPRITFVEGTGTQPVHLVYTDYDSYRSPAGLKVVGNSSSSSSPAWFEVEGKMYAAGMELSDQSIAASKTVLNVAAKCTAAAGSGLDVYGLKVALNHVNHSALSSGSAAIFASATWGYAGKFSGSVQVSATLTANSLSAATVYQTSDDRLKDYIGEFHFALADLERIPLRLFRFKADSEGKIHIGTSAQAVQKVLPEIVGQSRTASEDDTEEYLNVDYSKLALVALDCVRQLRDEVAALRAEIKELKHRR